MVQVLASAEARSSRSLTRPDKRRHSRSMLARNWSCFSGAAVTADRLERMTDRGERSSWEAAAINSFCFFRLSSIGFRERPTSTRHTR